MARSKTPKLDSASEFSLVTSTDAQGSPQVAVTQRIVKITAMSTAEKGRIEKLIDNRADALRTHLSEMQNFSTEANENVAPSRHDELQELKNQISGYEVKLMTINEKSAAELADVTMHIRTDRERKVTRLEAMIDKIKKQTNLELAEAQTLVEKKYDRKRADLNQSIEVAKQGISELERIHAGETLLRKFALKNSFAALNAEISDQRSRAVESLWTDATVPEDARRALDMLPDSLAFRKQVTPDHLFTLFDQTLKITSSQAHEMLCAKCQSADLRSQGANAYFCRKCSHTGKYNRSVTEISALPSLADIMQSTPRIGLPAPKSESESESVQPIAQPEDLSGDVQTIEGTSVPTQETCVEAQ